MRDYFAGIWAARYFWMHLALSDLRSRWRRSYFGVLWSILQPLGFALLLSFVLSRLLQTDIRSYAPYIFSGMIVWEFFTAVLTGGSLTYVQADAYIKNYRHPLAIYSLRTVLANLSVLALASIPMTVWAAVAQPARVGASWVSVLAVFPMLLAIAWPAVTLLGYIGARFRDLPNVMALAMQALWFASPVYFEAEMFRRSGLHLLVDANPIFHVLQLVRAPLLEGRWPTLRNYLFCLVMAALLTLFAWLVGRRSERRVIFYL